MHEPNATLPDYENPPVIEVVCGAQFEPLQGFGSTTFGTFWQRVRKEYPLAEDREPLPRMFEEADGTKTTPFEPSATPPLRRVFLYGKDPRWLMQVQGDRLLHNWRKLEEQDVYPHYPEVSKRFWNAWTSFTQFCLDEQIGRPHVQQLEVTYINHIEEGRGWSGLSNMGRVFPDLSWRPKRAFLPSPEFVQWVGSFPLPDGRGRLHVAVRPARRRKDNAGLLLCELTARGTPERDDDEAMGAWFDLGREWIVRAFADLASDEIQSDVWRRRA